MKRLSGTDLIQLALFTMVLFLCCLLYSSVAFMGTLPASPFVIGTFELAPRLILSFVACALFLFMALPLFLTPPSGGAKIRSFLLIVISMLTLSHLWSQIGYYFKAYRPLHVRETVFSVGGDLIFLFALWLIWAIARRSTLRFLHFALGWLISFYFICIGSTSFEYSAWADPRR